MARKPHCRHQRGTSFPRWTRYNRPMIALLRLLAATFVLFALSATAEARAQSSWDNVERIVVMGDMHGDYDKFEAMLRDAGLIDAQGNWAGGQTHFVQLGDVPDRGPNSRGILDHLMRLEPQAQRAGGYVHALIGNHEAMNVEGDLRYVSAAEFASYTDSRSSRRRESYYRHPVDPAHIVPRDEWEASHPLGWVEQRVAWQKNGIYGRWVSRHDAVIRINDTLFMHGGLGPAFASTDRETLNDAVRGALQDRPVSGFADILTNEQGPLWYRGLATNPEDTERANVDALLARHGVARIVVGHTKRASMVFPRFGGRVVLTDIAVPAGFTDPHAFLVIEGGVLTSVYRGARVPLQDATEPETCAYITQIAALDPQGSPNAALAAQCAPSAPTVTAIEPIPSDGSAP